MQDINFRSSSQNNNINLNKKVSGFQSYQTQNTINQNDVNNNLILLGTFVTLVLLGGGFFLFSFVFNSATISIVPLQKEVQLNETFIIEKEDRGDLLSFKEITTNEDVALPKTVRKAVSSSASGNITIYSNSAEPQKLVKSTRFETVDGKIFRIQTAVDVPAKSGSKMGTAVVKVVAETTGDSYNIGPSKFTIPGLKSSPKYKLFYAENKETLTGGSSGNQNSVSDLEIEKGKMQVKEKNLAYLNKVLSEKIPEGFSFSKDSLIVLNGAFVKIKEDDDLATYSQKATGTAIYFNKNLIIEKYLAKTEGDSLTTNGSAKVLNTDSTVVSLLNNEDLLDNTKPLRIVLSGTAPVKFYPNKEKIIDYYLGKPLSEFEDIVNRFQFISSASKTIRPFWANAFPLDISKIIVEYEE